MPFKSKRALAGKRTFEKNRDKIVENRRLANLKRLGSLAILTALENLETKHSCIKHPANPKSYYERLFLSMGKMIPNYYLLRRY